MYHGSETHHCTKGCPHFPRIKEKMEQHFVKPSQQSTSKEVNHTMQWAPNTNNIPQPILHSFHLKLTKMAKASLQLITNPITMPQPIIFNLHQFHK
jgi:hypothetical protein